MIAVAATEPLGVIEDIVLQLPTGLAELPAEGDIDLEAWRSLAAGALRVEAAVEQYVVLPLLRFVLPAGVTVLPGSATHAATCWTGLPSRGTTTRLYVLAPHFSEPSAAYVHSRLTRVPQAAESRRTVAVTGTEVTADIANSVPLGSEFWVDHGLTTRTSPASRQAAAAPATEVQIRRRRCCARITAASLGSRVSGTGSGTARGARTCWVGT
jgi:hypothetical protein